MVGNHGLSPLFTDLYQLTMGAGYFENHMSQPATFSLFVRNCPPSRNFLVAAGLEDVLNGLESLHFSKSDVSYLRSTGLFSSAYIDYLEKLRFTGDIFALPEGAIFFPQEPVLEITAPVIEAQLVETFVLNAIGYPTLTASKAARCRIAAGGRQLIDFSLRRTPGIDSGVKAARSFYLAGFSATSNVLAGKCWNIPVSGTMAHSFVMAFENEYEAFLAYSRTFPDNTVFLIDTYGTLEGAKNAVLAAKEMEKNNKRLKGVRLDSADMVDLSIKVRDILDNAGLSYVKIFASSGFDEYAIEEVLSKGAKIDAFGVGTKLGVSADAPYLDVVYKLVHYNGQDVRKKSPGKTTLGGKKQVLRRYDDKGLMREDIIGTRDEKISGAVPLMKKVMERGSPVAPRPLLEELKQGFDENFSRLPEKYKTLDRCEPFPVIISRELNGLQP
jgi:nicotinate phosphoribosyltransferase